MAQAPGIQMTSYDVGGSRTGTQTGFLSYGFGDQNQTKLEGIDTTEGTGANAGYFDFGSFEEFQVGGAGCGRRQLRRRHQHEHHRQVRRRSLHGQLVQRLAGRRDDQRQRAGRLPHVANQRDEDGYFSSTRADARQPDRPPVRHQLQHRRPALEAEGVVLLQLSPERPVQVHARHRRRSRARSCPTTTPSRAPSSSIATTR